MIRLSAAGIGWWPFGHHGRLIRAEPQNSRKAVAVGWPDFGVQQSRRSLAVEDVQQLFGGDPGYIVPRLPRDPGRVRTDHDVVEVKQRMVGGRRLVLPNVQAGARKPL